MVSSKLRAGALACGLLSFVSGCVEQAPSRPAIQFAVADSAGAGVHVEATRTVASRVNVAEPLFVGFEDDHALVTYAQRRLEGAALALDEGTLAPISQTAWTYPGRAKGGPAAHLGQTRATVALEGGRTLFLWTDGDTGHVLAEVDGSYPVTIWAGDAVGAPHAATRDGRHVVVAFATSTENGFDLVAMSLEAR
jgi:hypothetical protein